MALIDDLRRDPRLANVPEDQLVEALLEEPEFRFLPPDVARATITGRSAMPDNERRGFMAGVKQGLHSLGAAAGGLTAMAGEELQSDALYDAGMGLYDRQMERAGEHDLGYGFTDFFSPSEDMQREPSWGEYAAYQVGAFLPSTLLSMGTGMAGGLGARGAVSGLTQGAASRQTLARATQVGQAGGAWAGGAGQYTGTFYGEMGDAEVARTHGAIAGALDALFPSFMLRTLSPAQRAQLKGEISEGVGRRALEEAAERGILQNIARRGAQGAGLEGPTEALQQLVEQHARHYVETNGESLAANYQEIDWRGVLDGFGAGAFGGGGQAAPAGALDSRNARAELQQLRKQEEIANARQQAAAQGGDALDQARAGLDAEQGADALSQQEEAAFAPGPEFTADTYQRLNRAMGTLDFLDSRQRDLGGVTGTRMRSLRDKVQRADRAFEQGDYEQAAELLGLAEAGFAEIQGDLDWMTQEQARQPRDDARWERQWRDHEREHGLDPIDLQQDTGISATVSPGAPATGTRETGGLLAGAMGTELQDTGPRQMPQQTDSGLPGFMPEPPRADLPTPEGASEQVSEDERQDAWDAAVGQEIEQLQEARRNFTLGDRDRQGEHQWNPQEIDQRLRQTRQLLTQAPPEGWQPGQPVVDQQLAAGEPRSGPDPRQIMEDNRVWQQQADAEHSRAERIGTPEAQAATEAFEWGDIDLPEYTARLDAIVSESSRQAREGAEATAQAGEPQAPRQDFAGDDWTIGLSEPAREQLQQRAERAYQEGEAGDLAAYRSELSRVANAVADQIRSDGIVTREDVTLAGIMLDSGQIPSEAVARTNPSARGTDSGLVDAVRRRLGVEGEAPRSGAEPSASPAAQLAAEFQGIDQDLFQRALDAGRNERQIRILIEDDWRAGDLDGARRYLEAATGNAERNRQRRQEQAPQDHEAARQAEIAEIGEILGLPDFRAGRARDVLNQRANFNGRPMTRKARIEEVVEQGGYIEGEGASRELVYGDDATKGYDQKALTKTGMDYAEALIQRRDDAEDTSSQRVEETTADRQVDDTFQSLAAAQTINDAQRQALSEYNSASGDGAFNLTDTQAAQITEAARQNPARQRMTIYRAAGESDSLAQRAADGARPLIPFTTDMDWANSWGGHFGDMQIQQVTIEPGVPLVAVSEGNTGEGEVLVSGSDVEVVETGRRRLTPEEREAMFPGEANEVTIAEYTVRPRQPDLTLETQTEESLATREREQQQAQQAEADQRPQASENTIFTEDAAERAREILRRKLGQINTGIDPEMFQAGVTLAGYHIEKGARTFAAYARAMVDDLGEAAKPYLKSWYMGVKYDPRAAGFEGMDDAATVDQADVDAVLADTETANEQQPDDQGRQADQGRGQDADGGRGDDAQPGAAPGDSGNLGAQPTQDDGAAEAAGDTGGVRPGNAGADVAGERPAGGSGVRAGRAARGGQDSDAGAGGRGERVTTAKDPASVSPANPGPGNFHIENPLEVVGGGQVARFKKNQAAIEKYIELRDESRQATREEQEILAGYTGWGSFGQELFQGSWAHPKPKPGWEARDQWLRDHLGQAEWEGMQRSITNAHYTDPPTVMAMWSMLERMGFKGGRVLEPSMGIGNFYGMMPLPLKNRSQLTGIELDPVTGGMAKQLYPDATVSIMGYQESRTPDDFYDVVIGNWPFENTTIADRRYNRLKPFLHDYFYLKAIDQVRPGGIVMGITSSGTMDKKDARIRRELAKNAELVAAFRLPTGAFEEYAGTAVVTDIIILRKRPEPLASAEGAGWIDSVEMDTPAGEPVSVNEYYQAHPEHVIGTINWGHGTTRGRPGMIVDRPSDMAAQLERIVAQVPEDGYRETTRADSINYVTNHTADREGALTRTDDGLFVVRGEHLAPAQEVLKYAVKSDKTTRQREAQLNALIDMRQAYAELIESEQRSADNTEAKRQALREQFEAFTSEHGRLADSYGMKYLKKIKDPFYTSLAALEIDGRPAQILRESTMRGAPRMENPSVREAFVLARNGEVNPTIEEVAELAGVDPQAARAELLESGAIFEAPGGDVVPSDVYLSGNVREKMRQAQAALAEGNEAMQRNIDALREVMPPDVPYFNIEVQMGASWVPTPVYEDFIAHMLNLPSSDGIDVSYTLGNWKVRIGRDNVSGRAEATTGFGTEHYDFTRLVNAAISNQTVTIKRTVTNPDGSKTTYVDQEATDETNAKIAEMREQFGEWLWSDPERRVAMEGEYNEVRNAYASPRYDGSFMTFQGMALTLGNNPFNLREHQVNAIWRALVTRKSLNAHEVGTGKSFTIAGIAVESRRYGIARKPLVLAHNANSKSVAADINVMYPSAKVLYIDNLSPKDIDVRMRQIANDDWDAVVVPHSLIDRLAMTEETLTAMAREEIDALEAEAREAAAEAGVAFEDAMLTDEDALKKLRDPTAKDLVKARNKIIESIKKQAQMASREGAIPFEELGIDMVLVDEAHEFKKPPITTKMRMKGLQTQTSNRSIALSFMTRYVRANNHGGNVHLFTGTPITNTLTEIFHQMRYIMNEEMSQVGVDQWDGWFGSFAKEVQDVELNAAGEYESVTRLRGFINVPELRKMVGQYMDVVFSEDMPEMQPRRTDSGKVLSDDSLTEAERAQLLNGRTEGAKDRPYKQVIVENADLTEEQQEVFARVQMLDRRWKQMTGKQRKEAMANGEEVVPILYEQLANRASFDARTARDEELAGQEGQVPDDPNSKISRAINNILEIHQSHDQATQVVFTDTGLGTSANRVMRHPDGSAMKDGDGKARRHTVKVFSPIRDMVERLVQQGIPREQIAIIDGSTSKEKRKEIAEAMNRAEIRLVIGSTAALGVGVNMQRNLRAMHHLDAPYMPGDLEQRNGRGHRQGNQWNTVREYRYVTDRIDGRRWQILSIKQQFILDFLKADDRTRVIEGDAASSDDNDILSTFAEAAGDPRILTKHKLERDLEQLRKRERMHTEGIANARGQLKRNQRHRQEVEAELERWGEASVAETATQAVEANRGDAFQMEVNGTRYAKRKDANDQLKAWVSANLKTGDSARKVGEYGGIEVQAFWAKLAETPQLRVTIGDVEIDTGNASVQSLEATLRGVPSQEQALREELDSTESTLARLEETIGQPFAHAEKLERTEAKIEAIEKDMAANPVPPPAWLRNGTTAGTAVRWNGSEFTVTGHRWGRDDWYVLAEREDGGEVVIPYLEATDDQGMPLYEERPFEAPEVFDDVPADIRQQYSLGTKMLHNGVSVTIESAPRLERRASESAEAAYVVRVRDYRGEASTVDIAELKPDEGDVVSYSLEEHDRREQAMPANRAEVQSAINDYPGLGSVQVLDSAAGLPQEVLADMRANGIDPGQARGAYHNGQTYVVASNVNSIEDGIKAAVHEAVGHQGIRGVLGDSLDTVMLQVYRSLPKTRAGRRIMARIQRDYPHLNPNKREDRIAIGEELVAHMLESGERPKAWQRAVAAIRGLLRQVFPTVAWTHTDVLALGERSRQWLRQEAAQQGGDGGGVRYSLGARKPSTMAAHFDDFTDADRAAASKIGRPTKKQSAIEKWQEWTDRLGLRLRQGMVDQFAALKELDKAALNGDDFVENKATTSSWVLARMSNAANGALHAMLHNGRIYLDQREKVLDVREDGGSQGLGSVFAQLGEAAEIERFMGWIAGNRASVLRDQGRENLFTDDDIDAMVSWDRGTLADGRRRAEVYGQVFEQFQQYRDDVLEIAEQAGLLKPGMDELGATFALAKHYKVPKRLRDDLRSAKRAVDRADDMEIREAAEARLGVAQRAVIDAAAGIAGDLQTVETKMQEFMTSQRELWADEFYVPFYRIKEEEKPGSSQAMLATSGLSRQQAYKKLKGGRQNLNDLLQNTMLNFHHLLEASLKNQAAQQAMDNAEALGIAVPTSDQSGKNVTFVMRDGERVNYEINDPMVFAAVTALAHPGMNSTMMKVLRWFKRTFTNLTTATPQFQLANLIRDSLQAVATNEVSKNALSNVMRGAETYRDEATRARMMASGAAFNFGHLFQGSPDELRAQMTRTMRDAKVIASPKDITKVMTLWNKWQDVNNFTENINRAAIYQHNMDAGRGKLYSAFEARDLIDFSARGAWPAVRILIDIVPFLNARIQGLDKIYRSGVKPGANVLMAAFGKGEAGVSDKQAAARFWTVTGALTLATIALYLHNEDDEEYQKLEDWHRDTYWWFRVGDSAISIPKPFEVGAIATVAERITQQFVDDRATGALFRERMSHMVWDTFSFNPTPQAAQPLLNLYANKDDFTGRPIETMGMERLSPELRRRSSTTAPATGISRFLNATVGAIGDPDKNPLALSPVQVDHLIQGYFGQIGAWVAGVGDVAWRTANGERNPAKHWHEYQPVRRFYRDLSLEDHYTKHGTVFYDGLREAQRAYADVKELRELGELERAARVATRKQDLLAIRLPLQRAQVRLRSINQQMDMVRQSDLSPMLKRQRLDRLRAQRNAIQRVMSEHIQEVRSR